VSIEGEDKVAFIPESRQLLGIWSAVLASRGIPFAVEHHPDGGLINVPGEFAEEARNELWSYHCGNIGSPPPKEDDGESKSRPLLTGGALACGLACALVLALVYVREISGDASWREAGVWNAERIVNGDWWRLVTALTLHADISHLLSNIFWIALLDAFLTMETGGGMAALLAVVTGVIANAGMLFAGAEHSSLGASTMVFSLVGLLCAIQFLRAFRRRIKGGGNFVSLVPWKPLFAGLVVFAFYGTGPGTDVLAHGMGLVSGMLVGFPAERLGFISESVVWQLLFATMTLGVLALVWNVAL
jgi:membrane associated rhomboid family serine protease